MNELEKMKELWKEVHENKNNYTQINKEQIMENLTLKSNSVFEKLSKSVKFELKIMAIWLPVFLILAFLSSNDGFKFSSITFAIVCVSYVLYFLKDYKKIQNYSSNATNLRESLNEIITHLEKFIKIYFRANMFLWPIVGVLFIFASMITSKKTFSFSTDLPILIAFMVGSTLVGYFIQGWFIEKMYGKYVKVLKDLQHELEAEV